MKIPSFIKIASIADYLPTDTGKPLTRQRLLYMVRNPEEGDNRARVLEALDKMRDELNRYLAGPFVTCEDCRGRGCDLCSGFGERRALK